MLAAGVLPLDYPRTHPLPLPDPRRIEPRADQPLPPSLSDGSKQGNILPTVGIRRRLGPSGITSRHPCYSQLRRMPSPPCHRRTAESQQQECRRFGNGKSRIAQRSAILPEDIGDPRRRIESVGQARQREDDLVLDQGVLARHWRVARGRIINGRGDAVLHTAGRLRALQVAAGKRSCGPNRSNPAELIP